MLRVLDEKGHPALGAILRELRSIEIQNDRHRFRSNMRLLGTLMAFEIGATLEGRVESVVTPLGSKSVTVPAEEPILATALRAGLPFHDGMLEVFRSSDSMFFGAARVEGRGPDETGAIPIEMGYRAFSDCRDRTVIFADPMVATGSTIIDIHAALVAADRRPGRFIVAGLVGFREAADRLAAAIPGIEVWFATCDDELDARGYIVPGLGDAGDLAFGPKD